MGYEELKGGGQVASCVNSSFPFGLSLKGTELNYAHKALTFEGFLGSHTRAKMKGFCKGMKYISQIFVVKERDFEIGYPTDVKHVAYIGADGLGGALPSWMNGFKAGPDFSAPTLGSFKEKKSTSSKDLNQSAGCHEASLACKVESPTVQKKLRRKKPKSNTSSPRSTSRHSRTTRSKQVKADC